MLTMKIQMPMIISQLDWLSRPFINKTYPEYKVSFKLKIPDYNFYTELPGIPNQSYLPEEVIRITSPEEEYRILQFETFGIDGSFEGKEVRRYFLDLKKKLEDTIIEIGIKRDKFFIEVEFTAEELPDMRVY